MLLLLNKSLQKRYFWLAITISATVLMIIALFLQYTMKLQPCVLCIYERCALLGILLVSLFATFFHKIKLLNISATVILIYSAWQGVMLAWQQYNSLKQSSLFFASCFLPVQFPTWLPLDQWLPFLFHATGDCSKQEWQPLSYVLIAIFIAYLLLGCTMFYSDLLHKQKK